MLMVMGKLWLFAPSAGIIEDQMKLVNLCGSNWDQTLIHP